MPYLNSDDGKPDHPKVAPLSDAAYRLHDGALHYAAKYLLDGYLTPAQLADRKGHKRSTLRELLDAGLLHDAGEGCGTKKCPEGRGGHYLLHCDAFDLERPTGEPVCADCGCVWDDHNSPSLGGGCSVCGIDCEGWR